MSIELIMIIDEREKQNRENLQINEYSKASRYAASKSADMADMRF